MLLTLMMNIGMFGDNAPPVEPGDYNFVCRNEKIISESNQTCETETLIYNCTKEKIVYEQGS